MSPLFSAPTLGTSVTRGGGMNAEVASPRLASGPRGSELRVTLTVPASCFRHLSQVWAVPGASDPSAIHIGGSGDPVLWFD